MKVCLNVFVWEFGNGNWTSRGSSKLFIISQTKGNKFLSDYQDLS